MWIITTTKEHSKFGSFDSVVFIGSWDDMRKDWFKLTNAYGNVFRYSFNMY